MKRSVFAAMLLCVVSVSAIGAGDILQQLRYSKDEAQKDIVFSFSVGQIGDDRLRSAFRNASPAARAALVEQVLTWTKAYVSTPAFDKAYAEFRDGYKPEEPGTEGSAEDVKYARDYYNEQLAEWKENYPPSSREIVKRRLREFLEESSNVDYDAKLVRKGSKMRFVNDDYEGMSGEWKVCYRAGREPVERARAFAKAWLAELK